MKIVLDTNVLVSGLLNPYGAPGQIVLMVASGEISLCFDARILAEYREVLLRPNFGLQSDQVAALLEQVRAGGVAFTAYPLRRQLPDRDDEPFLEVAIASNADFLVTGNIRHYPVSLRAGATVVSPATFLEEYQSGEA
jgi:uncharacterized protein